MRLLNVHTLQFEDFYHDNIESVPRYIIASHRWSTHESKYKDVHKTRRTDRPGYKKVEAFCETIRQSNTGVQWLWIDTVCIDQSSSAELHESINSMFRWYANAECCLAYLEDVRPGNYLSDRKHLTTALEDSEWFRRGWTLQELIAPKMVVFLDQAWNTIGHKGQLDMQDPRGLGSTMDMTSLVSDITGISEDVLYNCDKRRECDDEEKMSWMLNRETTRIEDLAYCLLGIFEVFMPLVYGEGDQSRQRLLKEILAKKEADKVQSMEEANLRREAEIDWELISEERALDLTHQVSRLRRKGYNSEEAMYQIALRWQRQLEVPVEQAIDDIGAYLRAIEQHAAWTRHQYKTLRRQGLTHATCVRRMEAEMCRTGYNVIDAHRSVRNRLYYRPLSKKHNEARVDKYGQVQVPSKDIEKLSDSRLPQSAATHVPTIKVRDFAGGDEQMSLTTIGTSSSLSPLQVVIDRAGLVVSAEVLPAGGSGVQELIVENQNPDQGAVLKRSLELLTAHNTTIKSPKLWKPANVNEFVRVVGPLLIRKALKDLTVHTPMADLPCFIGTVISALNIKIPMQNASQSLQFRERDRGSLITRPVARILSAADACIYSESNGGARAEAESVLPATTNSHLPGASQRT